MSHFFIDRPIFAWVIGLILMLGGGVEIFQLPIAEYPSIAAPQVSITTTYPGASAQTIDDTVVRPIQQQLSGLDGLEYISTSTQANGTMEMDLTFKQGTDINIAQVQVQNKSALAQATLPAAVVSQGLRINKSTKNFMMVIGFTSEDGSMSAQDITDYVASNIQAPLGLVDGVGDYTLFGAEYAMRIWLNPGKLFTYSLTAGDVAAAINNQNLQVSSGELGGLPATAGQRLDATIIGPSRFENVEQFENILLKVSQSGAQVRLRDVARVELGSQQYSTTSLFNGKPAAAIALKLAPGANQISTEKSVRSELDELKTQFPSGLKIVYPLDTEPFIFLSIREVVITLIEAIALVCLVMFIFLQNWRATLIPMIAVPTVLLGTFAVLALLGYSINTLTMLAMVLAVGLLVDDAIVVVENVQRLMDEEGLSPRDATRRSMDEVSSALIGIAIVLSAVFLPMAFLSGSTGVIYRQFSVTIVSAMMLSVMIALILTPALCASLLQAKKKGEKEAKNGFFGGFNRTFDKSNRLYIKGVSAMTSRLAISALAFGAICGLVGFLFMRMPTGFLPNEDQGLLFGQVATPPGATAEQTAAIIGQVSDYVLSAEKNNVASVLAVNGFNFAGQAQNAGFFFMSLKDWKTRPHAEQSAAAIANRITQHFGNLRDGQVLIVQPPPVLELGNATGFDLELEDRGNLGHDKLLAARNQFLGLALKDPRLAQVRPNGLEDAPQYKLLVDREKASALGLSIGDINDTIQDSFGSLYVDQFLRQGRVKQVFVQGDAPDRMSLEDLSKWYVRNASNNMVPLSAFLSGVWQIGPQKVEDYNGSTAFEILGIPAPGSSSGQALAAVEDLVKKLPKGITFEWTGLSFEQKKAGSQTLALYSLSFIVILLCLAALYESWAIPIAVILVAPLGILGALAATMGRGLDDDIYFQVGLLTTVGLSVKNAILIIEFAKGFFEAGESSLDAAIHAARERLRPILMTSIAFACGVFPLAIATGAGASSRIAIGTALVGGVFAATFLAIFFVPFFFVGTLKIFRVKPAQKPNDADQGQPVAVAGVP